MVLSHWLERSIGQMLAPDANYQQRPDEIDTRSAFWQFVAPDPNFTVVVRKGTNSSDTDDDTMSMQSSNATRIPPPPTAFRGPPGHVRCVHCDQYTPCDQYAPVVSGGGEDNAALLNKSDVRFASPTPTSTTPYKRTPVATTPGTGRVVHSSRMATPPDSQLLELTHEATKKFALAMSSPPGTLNNENAIFDFCSSKDPDPTKERVVTNYNRSKDKVTKLLKVNTHLFSARSRDMGTIAPNGYTPLMVAAYANHIGAAKLLLELDIVSDQLLAVDLMGKTALHIAAEYGHVEMVQYLSSEHQKRYGTHYPCDLLNQTALGSVLTSPKLKAKQNQQVLYELLYTPTDVSIVGTSAPVSDRCDTISQLQLMYGYADKPGQRVRMEDAMIATTLLCNTTTTSSNRIALFGVCDGHSDNGFVSNFLAEEIPAALQFVFNQKTIMDKEWNWTECCHDICLAVDAKLKETSLPGGSTAVLAMITRTEIVVANVGDSRCILIQRTNDDVSTQLESPMKQLTVDEAKLDQVVTDTGRDEVKSNSRESDVYGKHSVIPLSNDHKPNLVGEKERIEAYGLSVVDESFMENNQEIILHKIKLSESQFMSTSRCFGDFEYKAKSKLAPDQQAVVAVPEVIVHRRTTNTDAFLVLACDGIWDVMSNEQVAQFVVDNTTTKNDMDMSDGAFLLPTVADMLTSECLQRGSRDNLSVIIVALGQTAEKLAGQGYLERHTLDFSNAITTSS